MPDVPAADPLGSGIWKDITARVWKDREYGSWEWDVRDHRYPPQRSTGRTLSWRKTMDAALEEVAWMATRKIPLHP